MEALVNNLSKSIFTIENFWTSQECEDFISKSEGIGYEPATIQTDFGQRIVNSVRNNNRVLYKDFDLAGQLWTRLKPFAPARIGNSNAVGLNELFRFYKYQAGQEFKRHRDQSYIRNNTESSYFTFMIYLNDNYEGGATTFKSLSIRPQQGMALVFEHALEHSGDPIIAGIKYVLRTDIMFRIESET
jgi:hypothetical protein